MRAFVTGQVGVDQGPYLEAVQAEARKNGIDLEVCHVGRMMYQEAPDVPSGRILNLPITRLNTLRRAVFKEILRTADKHVHRLPDGAEEPIPPEWLQSLAVEYFSSWRAPELVGPIKPLVGRGGRPIDNETNRLWRLTHRITDERARGGYKGTLPGFGRADAWLNRLNDAWSRFHGDDGTRIDAQIVDPDDEELLADLFVVTDVPARS